MKTRIPGFSMAAVQWDRPEQLNMSSHNSNHMSQGSQVSQRVLHIYGSVFNNGSHKAQLISLGAKMAIDRPVSWGLSGPIATSASRSSKNQTSVHTRTMSH